MSVLGTLPPLPLRRLARFLAVIAIAMAAGHLVQTLAARKPVVHAAAAVNLPQDIVQLSAGAGEEQIVVMAPAVLTPDVFSAANAWERVAPDCTDTLTLTPQPLGMIGVAIMAPCRGGQRVVLRHSGLAVTGKIGADGGLMMALPSLVVGARVVVLLQDGEKITQDMTVPQAATLRRFGVQWQGAEAFAVHGFENGAGFGELGDISAQNHGTGLGGVLTALGDANVENPLLAQVYTYPTDPALPTEVVLEAAVTQATCGHDLLGEAIFSNNGRATTTEITLAMPDCSGVGDFLVLKNLASDMKIAAN